MKDTSGINDLNSSLFSGGGEMGRLMRAFDWSKTSLGVPENWPHALKVMIRVLLDCQFPMYIAWGTEFIQFYNDAYSSILGIKHPHALGNNTQKTWNEIWPTIAPIFSGVMQGIPCGVQKMHFIMLRSGRPEDCYFNLSYSPIYELDGTIGGVIATGIETTEIIYREKRLQKKREELYSSFMQVPASVAVLKGPELVYKLCNPPYLQLIDKDFSIIGKPLMEVIPEIDPESKKIIFNVYKTGRNYIGNEHPVRVKRDGKTEVGYFNFNVAPLRNTDDEIDGIIIFAYEVTDQVFLKNKAEELKTDLEIAVKIREEFTSIASHELRTPLTILSLKLQMMKSIVGPFIGLIEPSELLEKTIMTANNQVDRLTGIVSNILDVTRIQTDNLDFDFEQMDVSILVKEVLEGFKEQLDDVKCEVNVELCPDLVATWDRFMIEQVLVNLISNVIKYAPGKPITIQTTRVQEKIQIVIEDLGPGVPIGYETKVFEPYERGRRGKNILGLGLGLFIADKIIKGHQGRIWVENGKNIGAKFIIHLPFSPQI